MEFVGRMLPMRRIAGLCLTLFATIGATVVFGQAPQAKRPMAAQVPDPAKAAADRQAMESLLGLWEKQSAKLNTLYVGFTRIDKSPAWDQLEEFRGQAYLQSPNLACLHFWKVEPVKETVAKEAAAKPALSDHERIVCTGTEVLQYDYKTKQIFRFPLDKQARKRALQEGPLPFLFNMKAAEAKERYGMTLVKETEKSYLISVVPHQEVDREVFSKAFIQLNKTTFLPDRLYLVSPNGKDSQDYVFSGVKANTEIKSQFFQALTIKGWKIIDNPGEGEGPRRAAVRPADEAAPAGPAGRPRMPAQKQGRTTR
jgi:TIGR03009 family protein